MGRVTDRRGILRIDTGRGPDVDNGRGPGIDNGHGPGIDVSHGAGADAGPGGVGAWADSAGGNGAGGDAAVREAGTGGTAVRAMDSLAGEEPMEIRIGRPGGPKRPLAVTMRTPGADIDLALGFLLTEGLIARSDDVVTALLCAGSDEPNTYNVVDVTLAGHVAEPAVDPARSFYTTSSCGVCGKASIEAVRTRSRYDVRADPVLVRAADLVAMPDRLRRAQKAFESTGGLHAAGLFTATGELVCIREDVGRHNAVDKVVGWALREGRLPLAGHVLLVSGRASFELAQKASMAGLPVLAAVSAPSTLAVDLAEEAGLTLIGFLRGATLNVYAGAARIAV